MYMYACSDDALFNYYMYACSDDALYMYACSDDALFMYACSDDIPCMHVYMYACMHVCYFHDACWVKLQFFLNAKHISLMHAKSNYNIFELRGNYGGINLTIF